MSFCHIKRFDVIGVKSEVEEIYNRLVDDEDYSFYDFEKLNNISI